MDVPVGNGKDCDTDVVVSLNCRSLSELLDVAEAVNEDLARKLLLGRKRKRELEAIENDSRVGDHSVADKAAGPDTPSDGALSSDFERAEDDSRASLDGSECPVDSLASDERWILNDNGEAVVVRIINGAIVSRSTSMTAPTAAPEFRVTGSSTGDLL